MFGFWNKKQKALEEVQTTLKQFTERLDNLEQQKKQLADENIELKQKIDQYENRSNSDEPWIAVTSERFDKNKGIAIGLDWNDAFIDYLHDNGVTGETDEEVVGKYLTFLYSNLAERMEQQVEQKASEKGKIADYE